MADTEPLPEDLRELVIPDHRWLSLGVARNLPAASKIILYIFGDFTLKLAEFSSLYQELSNRNLELVVASEAQKRMVGQLFPETVSRIRVSHYPLQLSQVNTSGEFRREFNLSADQKLIGYVGRMSRQKGVLSLIEAFLQNQSHLKAKLILCGPVDFHPMWQFSEEADAAGKKRFETLLKLASDQVIWIPFLDRGKLSGLYQSLELFVSPSTFHDEDYGLSVAEALSMKVPSLLSAWGGYLEHRHKPGVSMLNPTLGSRGYEITTESLSQALRGINSEAQTQARQPPLTAEERSYIIKTPRFLGRQGDFDRELYKKIYASYLLC